MAAGRTDRKGNVQEWVIRGQGHGQTSAGHLKDSEPTH